MVYSHALPPGVVLAHLLRGGKRSARPICMHLPNELLVRQEVVPEVEVGQVPGHLERRRKISPGQARLQQPLQHLRRPDKKIRLYSSTQQDNKRCQKAVARFAISFLKLAPSKFTSQDTTPVAPAPGRSGKLRYTRRKHHVPITSTSPETKYGWRRKLVVGRHTPHAGPQQADPTTHKPGTDETEPSRTLAGRCKKQVQYHRLSFSTPKSIS